MKTDVETAHLKRVSHWKLYLLILLVAFVILFVLSLNIGYNQYPIRDVLITLFEQVPGLEDLVDSSIVYRYETVENILVGIRLPRVVCGALVGAALATGGVIYQGIFRNPMADPYVIGASTGASIGSALVLFLGVRISFLVLDTLQILAFVGSVITVLVVYTIARVGSRVPITTLILTGIAVSMFESAIVQFMYTKAETELLHSWQFWLIGSLVPTEGTWSDVFSILPFVIFGLVVAYLYSRDLNILALGEDQAHYLGVEIEKVKRILIITGALVTAAAVSISGLIGFVGLIIPHLTRIVVGPDHRVLIPTSALVGASFLMVCDAISRIVLGVSEAPVGIVTAFAGVPFFLYLLRTKRKGYNI